MPELELAVSATTRERRPAERNGREYWFLTDEELSRSERFHRLISEVASDCAYSCRVEADGTLSLESVTAGFTRVTGYTLDEVKRLGWMELGQPLVDGRQG